MKIHSGCFLAIALAGMLAGCGKTQPQPSANDIRQAATFTADIMKMGTMVDCSASGPTEKGMTFLGYTGFTEVARPKVLGSTVRPARLADGNGYVGAVEVRWEPGDRGATMKRTDVYVFDGICRALEITNGEETRMSFWEVLTS